MKNKMYFVGKFEVLSLDFIFKAENLINNGGNSLVFILKPSQIITFSNRKELIEKTFPNSTTIEIMEESDEIYTSIAKKSEKAADVDQAYPVKFTSLEDLDTSKQYIDYILYNHLFIYDEIYKMMTPKRYSHTVSVALTAIDIAVANKICPKTAFIGSILHDIGKDVKESVQKEVMEKHFKNHIEEESVVYHQFIGAKIAEEKFGIYNKDILDAIKYHTTGKKDMSDCAKIVYCADKIEPTRGYDSKYLIDACKTDLRAGFLYVLEENMKFLRNKCSKSKIGALTKETIEYYNIQF